MGDETPAATARHWQDAVKSRSATCWGQLPKFGAMRSKMDCGIPKREVLSEQTAQRALSESPDLRRDFAYKDTEDSSSFSTWPQRSFGLSRIKRFGAKKKPRATARLRLHTTACPSLPSPSASSSPVSSAAARRKQPQFNGFFAEVCAKFFLVSCLGEPHCKCQASVRRYIYSRLPRRSGFARALPVIGIDQSGRKQDYFRMPINRTL